MSTSEYQSFWEYVTAEKVNEHHPDRIFSPQESFYFWMSVTLGAGILLSPVAFAAATGKLLIGVPIAMVGIMLFECWLFYVGDFNRKQFFVNLTWSVGLVALWFLHCSLEPFSLALVVAMVICTFAVYARGLVMLERWIDICERFFEHVFRAFDVVFGARPCPSEKWAKIWRWSTLVHFCLMVVLWIIVGGMLILSSTSYDVFKILAVLVSILLFVSLYSFGRIMIPRDEDTGDCHSE